MSTTAKPAKIINWLALVQKLDPDREKPDIAYEFSKDRKFESTDHTESGIYKRS